MDGSFEPRDEDRRLLTGAGQFLDDEAISGAAWGVFVRSPHASAAIRRIDTAVARSQPGILAVLTAADLDAAGIGSVAHAVPVPGGAGMVVPFRPALVCDAARHVGDAVALVVGDTEAAARDAAELVEIDYEPREAVTDVARAVLSGAPRIWPEGAGNVALDWHGVGADPASREELRRIFAGAAHVARVHLINQRIVMAPMEPRGALALYDPADNRYVLHVASQSAYVMRQHLARTLGVPADRIRVISRDVGGAFGMRTAGYPEYPPLMLAAKLLGRPVRWRSTRQEGFVSDNQARDTVIDAALALDDTGRFLALDIDVLAALGAYQTSHGAFIATVNFARCLPCMYDIDKIGLRIRCLFTNTVPTGPYRGAGRPEANYALERLADEAARVSGIERIELRRRNLISSERMPYKTAVGTRYDSGDFPAMLEHALNSADAVHFKTRAKATAQAGRRRGLGVSCFLEIAGGQPGEGASVGFPGGSRLLLAIGVQASGQGHRTVYRRLVAERLGIPVSQVEFTNGDSDDEVPSAGAVASRSTMSVGGAVAAAIDAIIEKGRRVAAHVLEAAEADIAYRNGIFEIAGTDRGIPLFELAERAAVLARDGTIEESLDTRSTYDATPSFPNGVHIAEVEIDPGTGEVSLASYTAVDDCGHVLQPVLVEGQVQGGVAQGVGQVLLEWGNYDDDSGQLLAGSFMDYAMPRAADLPGIVSEMHPVLCRTNPLGVKGVGEAGTTASLAAVMNAIADALPPGAPIDMPATPERVWRALRSKRRSEIG
ncbi:MAG TPA: xanthine dehydrogenase family protein molybdopterin-binding subunit [Stellaceae bacterium]|jgi:carbon-monoxide dehydrogenase large subunit|nr:xanthine dehydrogenase family protein molybdopterin-binding subunit [Stellaceae bacterium]